MKFSLRSLWLSLSLFCISLRCALLHSRIRDGTSHLNFTCKFCVKCKQRKTQQRKKKRLRHLVKVRLDLISHRSLCRLSRDHFAFHSMHSIYSPSHHQSSSNTWAHNGTTINEEPKDRNEKRKKRKNQIETDLWTMMCSTFIASHHTIHAPHTHLIARHTYKNRVGPFYAIIVW